MNSILGKFKKFLLTLTDEELEYLGIARINTNENFSNDLNEFINNTLENLGIPSHERGTSYLKTAIRIAYENPDSLKQLTNKLYPETAKIHNSTSAVIQGHMRSVIAFGHVRGNKDFWKEVFTSDVHYRNFEVSNGYFLKGIVNYLNRQLQ